MRIAVTCLVLSVVGGGPTLASGPAPSIAAEARAAQRIVVATVIEQRPRFHVNQFGDRLIVTDTLMQVEETLKGPRESTVQVTIEGGTIGDLTLHVSDLPSFRLQDRAVLLLDRAATGELVPHGRGLGLLKLDGSDRIDGTALTLADVRVAVRSAVR
jgi:hypothetical protein